MDDINDGLVREAYGAGRWFPGDRDELAEMVGGFIEAADCEPVTGSIVSAISPHAGYVYSGKTSGYTFRAVRDAAAAGISPDTVVVVGVSHRAAFSGVALMDGTAVRTPLGATDIDSGAMSILCEDSSRIVKVYEPHMGEHSAENQLPFVQIALPSAKLVVALAGDRDEATVDALADALYRLGEDRPTLMIASSDMLHDADYDLVSATDRATLKQVEAMNHATIAAEWNRHKQTFCGITAVMAAMRLAERRGCTRGNTLYYRNSGDDDPSGRGHWVVGYGAVVFPA